MQKTRLDYTVQLTAAVHTPLDVLSVSSLNIYTMFLSLKI
jgi:hypothetical protein